MAVSNRDVPANIEAEEALLGAVLSEQNVILDVIDVVVSDDFYNGNNREIFQACVDVFNRGENIDVVTVMNQLQRIEKLDQCGGIEYLTTLADGNFLCANAVTYADSVAAASMRRKLIKAGKSITEIAYDPGREIDEIQEFSESVVFDVAQKKAGTGYSTLGDTIAAVYNSIGQNETGIPTGFVDLDKALSGGLKRSDLIIVGACPGMGKTAFMLEIAKYASYKKNVPVAVFNLEMSKTQMGLRILSSQSGVISEKIKTGKNINSKEWQELAEAAGELSSAPLYFDDTLETTVSSIRAKCRKLKLEKNIQLVIIDYLQLMSTGGKTDEGNRAVEVAKISRALKLMARELDVPVLVGSQLSRGVTQRDDKRPKISDLRESGAIEQDADIVMFLYREDYYNKETEFKNIAEVIVAKNRQGEQGTTKLYFDAPHVTFRNYTMSQTEQ